MVTATHSFKAYSARVLRDNLTAKLVRGKGEDKLKRKTKFDI